MRDFPETTYRDDSARGPYLTLVNGAKFYLLDPEPEKIDPEVIAHSLSKLCRWTGHTRTFYSVAQHSVFVSRFTMPEFAMQGLFHDATEAFVGDVSKPLKAALQLMAPDVFWRIEDGIHAAIAKRFGFDYPHSDLVKMADNVSLATEKRDLLENYDAWPGMPAPTDERIIPLGPEKARVEFLARYDELLGKPPWMSGRCVQ